MLSWPIVHRNVSQNGQSPGLKARLGPVQWQAEPQANESLSFGPARPGLPGPGSAGLRALSRAMYIMTWMNVRLVLG